MPHLRLCPSCGFHLDGSESARQFRAGVKLALISPLVGLGSCLAGLTDWTGPIGAMTTVVAGLAGFGTLLGLILLIGSVGFRREDEP